MQREQVMQIVESWLAANVRKYDCISDCELLTEEWMSNMMLLGIFSDRRRSRVWGVKVMLPQPSPDVVESPDYVTLFVDDETGEVQRHM